MESSYPSGGGSSMDKLTGLFVPLASPAILVVVIRALDVMASLARKDDKNKLQNAGLNIAAALVLVPLVNMLARRGHGGWAWVLAILTLFSFSPFSMGIKKKCDGLLGGGSRSDCVDDE